MAEASLEEQEVAATKIQALFRGIHDRAKVEAMKQEQVSFTRVHQSASHVNYCIHDKKTESSFEYFCRVFFTH